MVVRLSVLRAGPALPPGTFLVLSSVRGCINLRALVRLEGLGKLNKISSDLIGIRARDLPASGVTPQATTLPRAPVRSIYRVGTLSLSMFCSLS
jgi:hypothetical protein